VVLVVTAVTLLAVPLSLGLLPLGLLALLALSRGGLLRLRPLPLARACRRARGRWRRRGRWCRRTWWPGRGRCRCRSSCRRGGRRRWRAGCIADAARGRCGRGL